MADPAPACSHCRRRIEAEHRFCPYCGCPRDEGAHGADLYRRSIEARIGRAMDEERVLATRWRKAVSRQYAFGALVLSLPDACFLFLFLAWLRPDFQLPGAFQLLLLDAAIGMLTVLLVTLSATRGGLGDLMLIGLRLGQISLVHAAGLTPFVHDVPNVLFFLGVPLGLLGFFVLVLQMHVSDVMDRIARRAPLAGMDGAASAPSEAPDDSI